MLEVRMDIVSNDKFLHSTSIAGLCSRAILMYRTTLRSWTTDELLDKICVDEQLFPSHHTQS